ncbi:glycosyltransferase family 39 protein [Candidatus Bathyarchaeota archaeon]|nr:glycosyltransferase family 39 protein [Candidatus Bathyarchaeota archaeon]
MLILAYTVATLVVFYKFTRKMYNGKTALLASLFPAACPMHVYYSQNVQLETPMLFFTLSAMYLIYKWIKTDKQRFFLIAMIASSLALLTKIKAIFMLSIIKLPNHSIHYSHLFRRISRLLPFWNDP